MTTLRKDQGPKQSHEWSNSSTTFSQEKRKLSADGSVLAELIKVLTPYPGGLRRWSVMQAIRKDREQAAREIPPKFEDEVERTFRRFCADEKVSKTGKCILEDTLFYRPKDKAGEVWAIYPDRAKAWLDAERQEQPDVGRSAPIPTVQCKIRIAMMDPAS